MRRFDSWARYPVFLGHGPRIISRLGPLLALAPVRRLPDAPDRVWIVDGTLIPVRDRDRAAFSKDYRNCSNSSRAFLNDVYVTINDYLKEASTRRQG